MLALNPVAPERFLAEDVGGKCEQVAHKWLQKTTELDIPGLKGFAMEWHGSPVSHHVKGTLGYVQWNEDGTLLVNVPYPKTPYQLEVFLHELGHIWKNHSPQKACNGKTRNCRPGNREEYEAETFAMDIMRKEGVEISADILEDAQDNVVNSLFRDAEDGLPVSREAIRFVQQNDRLQTHRGWKNFLQAVEDRDMPIINPKRPKDPYMTVLGGYKLDMTQQGKLIREHVRRTPGKDYGADPLGGGMFRMVPSGDIVDSAERDRRLSNPATPEQYRLAQAVLHGTARTVTRMTPEAARKIIEDTPAHLRSEYSQYSENPVTGDAGVHWEKGFWRGRREGEYGSPRASTLDRLAQEYASHRNIGVDPEYKRFAEKWYREGLSDGVRAMHAGIKTGRRPGVRNPAEESADVYEEFHGRPSEQVVEVEEAEHYHSHLAELGILKGLKFRTPDGSGDVTLDFDCEDCDHGQSGNLWGFGGGGKKVSGSSRLMREAFEAGYNGTGGYRGDQEFREWLEHAAGDQDLSRGFKKSLKREYMRGMKNWETETKLARQMGKVPRRSAAAARGTKYATAVARTNPRKGPIARASEFTGSMAHGAARGIDSFFTGNPAEDDGPVILCSNERMNQLYLVGGDQAVDLGELKINARHDSVILGQCWAISYSTEKRFDDFEQIEYVHTFAPDKLQRRMSERADLWEEAKPPYQEAFESGDLPTLRYDVLNQTLHFDGGSYFVTDKGIED